MNFSEMKLDDLFVEMCVLSSICSNVTVYMFCEVRCVMVICSNVTVCSVQYVVSLLNVVM